MIPIFGGIFQGGGIFRMIRRILCNRNMKMNCGECGGGGAVGSLDQDSVRARHEEKD